MVVSPEILADYAAVLDKAQAYQVCGSLDSTVAYKDILSELVLLYKFKSLGDEIELEKRIAQLDRTLNEKIAGASNAARMDIIQFLADKKEVSWVYTSLNEIKDKLETIRQIGENIENVMEENQYSITNRIKPTIKKEVIKKPRVEPVKKLERKVGKPTGIIDDVRNYINQIKPGKGFTARDVAIGMKLKTKPEVKSVSDSLRQLNRQNEVECRMDATTRQNVYWVAE